MDGQVSLGFVDKKNDKAWAGFALYGIAVEDMPTLAEVQAYQTAINALVDGKLYNIKLIETTRTAYVPADLGESYVEYCGHIQIRSFVGGQKYMITLPSIKDVNVEKPVKTGRNAVVPYVTETAVTAAVAAFATMIGKTAADFEVIQNFISEKRV